MVIKEMIQKGKDKKTRSSLMVHFAMNPKQIEKVHVKKKIFPPEIIKNLAFID